MPKNINKSWVCASSTYNYMMKDPLLDWLKYHHRSLKKRNYKSIISKSLSESDNNYNFITYIMKQGLIFEKKIFKLLTKKFGKNRIININGESDSKNPEKVKETFEAMKNGYPFIRGAVLHNKEDKTFGIPDLLVRSDWLKFLVSESPISKNLENKRAPKLKSRTKLKSAPWHYRVVDIKFTTLLLKSDGKHLLNSSSFPAYKSQLLIYNNALGKLQGYTPPQAYILGRRWKYNSKSEVFTGNNCFDKLGIIDYSKKDKDFKNLTHKAVKWIKEVKTDEAKQWNILKYPLDRLELYPNMCNQHDYPWRIVKNKISEDTKELTKLWMVGPKNRNIALEKGICSWDDEKCTPENLGIKGEKTGKILKEILDINKSDAYKIKPIFIRNNIGFWKQKDDIEFFVDFETSNGAISSIKGLPYANIDNLIFMIGVGYIDFYKDKWIYKEFTVNRISFNEEKRICTEFAKFIRHKSKKYGIKNPKCFHWAKAEDSLWNDAVERHIDISDTWKSWIWNWVDLLEVFKTEPIVLHGCMSFGLKDIANTMKKHGFIETCWDKESSCIDGQSAMIAAVKAHKAAKKLNTSLKNIPVVNEIIKYNEVDVKVLYEIITYLRENHVYNPKKRSRFSEPILTHGYNLRKRTRQN
jgi:hypothetical protein